MKFEILDVEHGFSAYAIGQNGSVIAFDCGHSRWCQPSTYLRQQGIYVIRNLVISNYDEDHISDLPSVYANFQVESLTRNNSVTPEILRRMKTEPLSDAMEVLMAMLETYTGSVLAEEFVVSGIRTTSFHNAYPKFSDTNNLSVLTFMDIGGTSFVLSGDLETDGWLALLENPEVRLLLARAQVFVASHHGRESGYCREVFDWCEPSLVVMSDGPVKYDTQKMAGIYGGHATGTYFTKNGNQEWRKVVTTRNDGRIYWNW